MAVKTFEEIYSALSAQEKTLIDNLFAKEPELKGGWLRQDDYSRKQNELKSKEAVYEEAVAYKAKTEPWTEMAYDRIHNLEEAGVIAPDGTVLWTDQKAQLEQQLEAAKALGGDMDPKVLDDLVTAKVKEIAKNAGGLTREEATALYAKESKDLVEAGFKEREAKFNAETIPFVAGFSAGVAVLASRYEQESGEKWTAEKQKELYKLMSDEQNFDAFKVEEKFLAPIREKSADKKKREADIEAEVSKRLADRGMPGGGGERYIPQAPGGDARGLLQKALEDSAGSSDKGPVDVRDLVQAGVVEGARELIEAGKV
jgi:hypothetical protein